MPDSIDRLHRVIDKLPPDDKKEVRKREMRLFKIIDNPKKLDAFIEKETFAPLREYAQNLRSIRDSAGERLEREASESEKCPKCGKPLVDVEYYSCVRGKPVVTNAKTEWEGSTRKTTTTTSTPISNYHRHTARFCPACAGRKMKRRYIAAIIVWILGILLVPAGLILTSDNLLGNYAILIIFLGIFLAVAGFRAFIDLRDYAFDIDGRVTNGLLARSEQMHDAISELYIRTTPRSIIEQAEGTNAVVARTVVRAPQIKAEMDQFAREIVQETLSKQDECH